MSTTLNAPIHNIIRNAVLEAHNNGFNIGKPYDAFLIESIVHHVAEAIVAENEKARTVRSVVYEAIDTERTYQTNGFGNAADRDTGIERPGRPMTPAETLVTLDVILTQAKATNYRPATRIEFGHLIRKMAGVCVAHMEHYGAFPREFTMMQLETLRLRKLAASCGDTEDGKGETPCTAQAA